jgi:hypothetical protein
MESVLEDKRNIVALSCDLAKYTWRVGVDGVTKIEAYGEPGHMAKIPWFAIWINDELSLRMDGTAKTVSYS